MEGTRMKKVYGLLLFLALCSVVAAGVYYAVSMAQVRREQNKNRYSDADRISINEKKRVQKTEQKAKEIKDAGAQEPKAALPVSESGDKILFSTQFYLVEYNAATNTTRLKKERLPSEWIGMHRTELARCMEGYMQNLPLEETELGLVNYEVTEFSSEKIKLKKTYDARTVKFKYYAAVCEGMIVIYHSDKRTVFEYTGIASDTLEEKEQQALKEGIPIQDEEQLYGLLEAYSS